MADDTTASTTATAGKTPAKTASAPAATPAPSAPAPSPLRAGFAIQALAGILAHQGMHTNLPTAVDKALEAADLLIAGLEPS
jgi:hypothetical protein